MKPEYVGIQNYNTIFWRAYYYNIEKPFDFIQNEVEYINQNIIMETGTSR